MKHLLLISFFLLVFSSLFAINCTKYLDETIKPLEFRGTVISKKIDVKNKIYLLKIKTEIKGFLLLKLIINKSSKELYDFSKAKSMIKKEKNSSQISIATPLKNGSIDVGRFDISCE